MLLLTPLFWFMVAYVLAGLECEVEGPHGWASGMPTCRIENRALLLVLRPVFAGRPVTLYHCFMFSLVTMIAHAGYFQGVPMGWTNECRFLATLFLLCPTWDFLWFVLNPAYGVENFRREKVPWHADRWWVWGLFPVDYAVAGALSLAFSVLGWISDDAVIFDVINGFMQYFCWIFLLWFGIEAGGPYRRWRARKKPERSYHEPKDPPAKEGWTDSP
jgi:hypothetical protein